MPLPCTGSQLPDIPSVYCAQTITSLADCCTFVEVDQQILLYEEQPNRPYYWVILHADEMPLVVCELERYANATEEWQGRRADYIALGWYGGDCYLLIIELRDILVNERQGENKLDQIENSINQVFIRLNEQIRDAPIFNRACDQPEQYKLAGIVVAPAGIRRISREKRIRRIENKHYSAVITMMPGDRIRNCEVKWSELLETVGVRISTAGTSS